MKVIYATLAASALFGLAACGGGGGGSDNEALGSPEGAYEGTTESGTYHNALILENNQYYILYGSLNVNGVFDVAGLITGTGQTASNRFTSDNLRDFDSDGDMMDGTLSATYKPGVNFNGSASYPASTVKFTATSLDGSLYNYNAGANVANISGSWFMYDLAGTATALDIAADGSYTGDTAGCSFSGNITPRVTGKNVFDVSVTFGGAPCALPGQTASGHAIEFLTGSGLRQLIVAGTDAGRNNATVLIGAR